MVGETTAKCSRGRTQPTMALDQSALLEVLEALKAAEVDDRIRQAAEAIYQALIQAELTAVTGAYPHQRTGARTAERNGHRPRTITATAGDLELKFPRLPAGSFFPSLLERRRRADQSLLRWSWRPTCTARPPGRVGDLVKALGADTGISKSEVSASRSTLSPEVPDSPLSVVAASCSRPTPADSAATRAFSARISCRRRWRGRKKAAESADTLALAGHWYREVFVVDERAFWAGWQAHRLCRDCGRCWRGAGLERAS